MSKQEAQKLIEDLKASARRTPSISRRMQLLSAVSRVSKKYGV